MERDYFRDFFTSNKNADLLISFFCALAFAFGNAFYSRNFFTNNVVFNILIFLSFGTVGMFFNRTFFQLHFELLSRKNVMNSIFKNAFLRFSLIAVSFASIVKGLFLVVFQNEIAISAIVSPIIYSFAICVCLIIDAKILLKAGFLRATKNELLKLVFLPFCALAVLKILFLGVL